MVMPLWLNALLVLAPLILHGCGGGGDQPSATTTTTTTVTTTTTLTTTQSVTTVTTTLDPGPPPPIPTKLCPALMQLKMQNVAKNALKAPGYNLPVAVGYAGPDGSGGHCMMGYVAYPAGRRQSEDTRNGEFLYGSFTKMWTASAVMKLVEAGELNLDDQAFKYMEAAFQNATKGDSLVSIFGEHIKEVTIRELLSMRGSIADYDERQYQKLHPSEDLGPSISAKLFGKSLSDLPVGTCGVYSSMSYVLVGLLLIGQRGVPWDQYDQNVWKEHFPLVRFGIHGPCSQYTDAGGHCKECEPVNVMDMSCTNGFTCGNMIGPPSEVARFVWGLFMGQLLKQETVRQMVNYTTLGPKGATTQGQSCATGWNQGALYGLGVQAPADTVQTGNQPPENFPGHAGQTYGYTSISAFDHWRGAAYVAGVASSDLGAGAVWAGLHNALSPNTEDSKNPAHNFDKDDGMLV